MNQIPVTERMEQAQLEVLASGAWGTIQPHSLTAAQALGAMVGAEHALLCHSADAAYEAVLRHFGAAYGRRVIVGSHCESSNALIPICCGAMPLFVPVCERCGMVSPDALEAALQTDEDVCCVVVDLLAEGADSYPLDRIAALCHARQLPLVLNAGGCFSLRKEGTPPVALADAVLYSLEQGSEIYAGKGGLVATNQADVYAGAFAYHNCGRSPGDGCTLNVDAIVGGDLRVTEWTAVAAEIVLQSGTLATPAPRTLPCMEQQPVFRSDYAKKMTGIG